MIINCPTSFKQGTASDFAQQIIHYAEIQDLAIDFSTMGFIDPFSSLVLAHGIKAFIQRRQRLNFSCNFIGLDKNQGSIGYLKHLGFFRFAGINTGKHVGQAIGNTKYLPFTTIKKHQIMWKGRAMQAEIDHKSDNLAKIIFPGEENAGPAMMLGYSIREIIRNSFEHGGVDTCTATAQRWMNGDAEIAIADEGIGIFNSLLKTGLFQTPDQALAASILPGITSESVISDDEWTNSGFGLYVISELGKRYGDFEMISSYHSLCFRDQTIKISNTPISGTIVKLKVSTTDADYFPNILDQIVTQGEIISKSVPGALKTASKMSKNTLLW